MRWRLAAVTGFTLATIGLVADLFGIFDGVSTLLSQETQTDESDDEARSESRVVDQDWLPKPAPLVIFAGGEKCEIGFSLSFRLPTEHAGNVIAHFGNVETAERDLDNSMRASIIAVLENSELKAVRTNRTFYEEKVVGMARERAFSPGYDILGVALQEIACQEK